MSVSWWEKKDENNKTLIYWQKQSLLTDTLFFNREDDWCKVQLTCGGSDLAKAVSHLTPSRLLFVMSVGCFHWQRQTETPLCAQRSNLVEDLWEPHHFVRVSECCSCSREEEEIISVVRPRRPGLLASLESRPQPAKSGGEACALSDQKKDEKFKMKSNAIQI